MKKNGRLNERVGARSSASLIEERERGGEGEEAKEGNKRTGTPHKRMHH